MGDVLDDLAVSDVPDQGGATAAFSMRVNTAEEYGRADTGCAQFVGTVVFVELHHPEITFSKGSAVEIISLSSDQDTRSGGNNAPSFVLFERD